MMDLKNHTERLYSSLNGFREGFDIGYRGNLSPGATSNLRSATLHHSNVSKAIKKELDRGHTSGPFQITTIPFITYITDWGSGEER